MRKLNENFMAELFKLMFIDGNIMRMVSGHMTYQLIPKEWVGYKFLLKEAVEQFIGKEVTPSLGVIAQKYADNDSVQESIKEIKKARLVDKELIIDQLESFIRETEFELLSKKVHDLYEEGKRDEAIKVNTEESKRILEISLRKTGGKFIRVFEGFQERMKKRYDENKIAKVQNKVSLGIDRLDDISYGGADPGDTVLWIMRSGVGKSTVLKWHGYAAALESISVLHIQLEGGVDACTDKYDQMWTNQSYIDIKKGLLKQEDEKQIMKTLRDMKTFGQDIDIYGFEKFGQASMVDIRNLCIEYQKVYGHFPQLLIVDSLDLLMTGVNKKIDNDPEFTKFRLQKCSQLFKDICVEFKMVGITATQTGDVPMDVWNNEMKHIDRSNTEGDRTLVKPYSFVFTGNITMQEKKDEKCRIFVDKLRDYKSSQEIFSIATDYGRGRFYNRKRTMALYNDSSEVISTTADKPERKDKLRKGKKKETQEVTVI